MNGYFKDMDFEKKDFNKVVLTVSELNRIIKETLENNFYDLSVKGEISGLKTHYPSGYYFDVKDEYSKLKCIIFKSDINKIKFEIKEGILVKIYGRINLYEPRGEYSFIASEIEPLGYGDLYALFEKLKEKLKKEGLFDESRKKPLPFLPETIGVVTSKSGAVLHDMVKILNARFENISIIFTNVSVQGQSSAVEIARGIELLNLYNKEIRKIDVIIVGRGGGSIEDLWSFNEEIVARAIYNSAIPIISAVGHETDFTIADFVADRRASTPSNAAEIAVPVKAELLKQIKALRDRLERNISNLLLNRKMELFNSIRTMKMVSPERIINDRKLRIYDLSDKSNDLILRRIDKLKINIEHLRKRLLLKSPLNVFKERENYIISLSGRLRKALEIKILNYKNSVKTEIKALNSLSPYNVLERGYAIVFSESGKAVLSALSVKENDNIKIALTDGSLNAVVKALNFSKSRL